MEFLIFGLLVMFLVFHVANGFTTAFEQWKDQGAAALDASEAAGDAFIAVPAELVGDLALDAATEFVAWFFE